MLKRPNPLEDFQHTLSDYVTVQGTTHPESQLILLILPAMGAPAKLYKRLYDGIIQAGLSAAIMNLRGDGRLQKNQLVSGGNFGYAELLTDLEDAVTYITERFPGKRIITVGHSLGGQLGCLFQCHGNPHAAASIVIAGGNVGYQSWKGLEKLKTLFATQFFGLTASLKPL